MLLVKCGTEFGTHAYGIGSIQIIGTIVGIFGWKIFKLFESLCKQKKKQVNKELVFQRLKDILEGLVYIKTLISTIVDVQIVAGLLRLVLLVVVMIEMLCPIDIVVIIVIWW